MQPKKSKWTGRHPESRLLCKHLESGFWTHYTSFKTGEKSDQEVTEVYLCEQWPEEQWAQQNSDHFCTQQTLTDK